MKKTRTYFLAGNTYGRLTVERWVPGKNKTRGYYICVCICGNRTKAYTYDLLSEKKYSCGCRAGKFNRLVVVEESEKDGEI